jgi:hypothetical protein
MVSHMKTTLMIPDPLMRRLKREAARQRTTVSALVERAFRLLLEEAEPAGPLLPLPCFHGGGRESMWRTAKRSTRRWSDADVRGRHQRADLRSEHRFARARAVS